MESRSCGIPRGVRESKASANRGEGEFVIVISSLASADKRSHFYPALRVEEATTEREGLCRSFPTTDRKGGLMPIIALVDDDHNILTSVSIALEAGGYRVMTYSDGASALQES